MKLSKLKKGDIVIIGWLDSYSASRWHTDDEIKYWKKGLLRCTSIGCIFSVDEKSVVIYGDSSPLEKGRLMSIPKNVIQKIKLLK